MSTYRRFAALTGLIAMFGFAAAPSVLGASCGGHNGHSADAEHEGHAAKEPSAAVTSALEQYGKIQAVLAGDTLDGVADAARAISKTVTGDANKTLPAEVATQADTLANAKDLEAARAAFKPLGATLSKYLAEQKIQTGHYYELLCPMAKAGWLQTDKAVKNPYFGKSMLACGKIVGTY